MVDVETRKFLEAIIEELQNIDGGGSIVYSTEEIKVGSYFGHDLYKTSVIFNTQGSASGGWNRISHGILNIDEVVKCESTYIGNDGDTWTTPSVYLSSVTNDNTDVYGKEMATVLFANKNNFVAYVGTNRRSGKLITSIYYTKTSN